MVIICYDLLCVVTQHYVYVYIYIFQFLGCFFLELGYCMALYGHNMPFDCKVRTGEPDIGTHRNNSKHIEASIVHIRAH